MNILNLNAFDDASYYNIPWEWGMLRNLISQDGVKTIIEEVKNFNFNTVISHRSDKNYRMELIELQKQKIKSGVLNELIIELSSDNYITKLESLTNSQLRNRDIEFNIWCYSTADYLSPHVDKNYKFLTQLIYLNECWETCYGGSLNILSSSSEDDLYQRILPIYKISPLIKNSQNAWHSVSPVSSSAPSRYCLQIIYKD